MLDNDLLVKVHRQNLSTLLFIYNITTDWHRRPSLQLTISLHNMSFELETPDEKKMCLVLLFNQMFPIN